jgi:hypothetical protein
MSVQCFDPGDKYNESMPSSEDNGNGMKDNENGIIPSLFKSLSFSSKPKFGNTPEKNESFSHSRMNGMSEKDVYVELFDGLPKIPNHEMLSLANGDRKEEEEEVNVDDPLYNDPIALAKLSVEAVCDSQQSNINYEMDVMKLMTPDEGTPAAEALAGQ